MPAQFAQSSMVDWMLCFDHCSSSPHAALCTQLASLLAVAALQCHLLRRWLETGAVMVYPPHARMHLIAYIFGMRSVWPPTG
jgi:hypothetical protein